ncbi:MAG: M17 family peptidase N-terminal domain-containing protein, partial [Thermodesulfobacteriota bacterium]|nr:M17 family peptidase N-terminal domain-containing protein [Thermodesulfobacteriota bacterium]
MLQLSTIDPVKSKLTALAVPVAEDKNLHRDQKINALVKKIKKFKEFKGAKDNTITYYEPQGFNSERVILIGVGKADEIDLDRLRVMAGQMVKKAIDLDLAEIAILVPSLKNLKLDPEDTITAIGEGARLANHRFDKYKKPEHPPLKRIKLVLDSTATRYRSLIARVNTICEGTLQARNWVNTPANDKTPAVFAGSIKKLAQKTGLGIDIRDERWLKKEGFNTILAVAQGSQNRPRLVVLRHQPKGAKQTVALIGKGVTFDAGGINLKPTGSIETMKCDMSGAAAVAATLITAARLKLNTNLVGVIPIVENMPSGTAIRPGDIIKSWAGKTVEIGNTDAEGRL